MKCHSGGLQTQILYTTSGARLLMKVRVSRTELELPPLAQCYMSQPVDYFEPVDIFCTFYSTEKSYAYYICKTFERKPVNQTYDRKKHKHVLCKFPRILTLHQLLQARSSVTGKIMQNKLYCFTFADSCFDCKPAAIAKTQKHTGLVD